MDLINNGPGCSSVEDLWPTEEEWNAFFETETTEELKLEIEKSKLKLLLDKQKVGDDIDWGIYKVDESTEVLDEENIITFTKSGDITMTKEAENEWKVYEASKTNFFTLELEKIIKNTAWNMVANEIIGESTAYDFKTYRNVMPIVLENHMQAPLDLELDEEITPVSINNSLDIEQKDLYNT